MQPYDLVVFSHLRWDFVYQRPQHLLSRLARGRRVLVIEEPIHQPDTAPHWIVSEPEPGVSVTRLHTPVAAPGFADEHIATFATMLPQLLAEQAITAYVVWLYTPMALPLAQLLAPHAVVYDCMDELSAFQGAPPELLEREELLFGWADLVFTGGRSIYRAKQDRHPAVHCFPSSVDAAHFRQAIGGTDAPDQATLPHPRFGFYGVIDERMDLTLVAALAHAHPDWQIIMVGPVVKIDPAGLPRAHNLRYLGQRRYDELPGFLAGWDVCMLPFARNESTRFISPTKTLEYMAAEKPIVSTPITDVAEPYGTFVYLGDSTEAFVAACEQALHQSDAEREQRLAAMRQVLANTSWDTTAAAMAALIDQTVAAKTGPSGT